MSPPNITCVFYTSPTIVGLLVNPASHPPVGNLFVECSTSPSLGYALGLETPTGYPGIAGLLGGASLGSLAYPTDRLPAPVVLAPGTPTAPAAVRAALSVLEQAEGCPAQVVLLVSTGEASALGAALAVADHFLLAWDITEFPHDELLDFARWLGRERLLDRGSFQGVLAYASQPADTAHCERLTTLLAPLATVTRPAGVVPFSA